MPIRVFYLITDLKTGGVPLHLYRLVAALDRSEFEPVVACLAPPGEVGLALGRMGIRTLACGARGSWDVRALGRLASGLRRERPDVVHALLFHANTAASLVCPWVGIPARRIIHEIQTVEIERRWHLVVGGMTGRWCRWVVGNSAEVVEHLHRRAHISRSRLRLIRGGVDVARFSGVGPADRHALGIPAEAIVLLWVGRLDPVKGLEDLIEARRRLKDDRVYVVLVGEGEQEGELRRQIRDAGLIDRILLTGRRDDIPQLLAMADLFVFPSLTEGLPNALLEAMAAGRPIVTTRVPGCQELIADGRTGVLVSPRSPGELADGIRRLIGDRAWSMRLGQNAFRHVADHYGIEATVRQYAELYRGIVRQ